MILPKSCVRAAVIHRGRLRSIVPLTLDATSTRFGASEPPRSSDRRSSSTISRASPRQFRGQYPTPPTWTSPYTYIHDRTMTPAEYSLVRRATRQFSTAVAAEYPSDDESDDESEDEMYAEASGYRKNNKGGMPRLQALRERLLVEKHTGGMSGVRQPDPPPGGNSHSSENAARVLGEEPAFDHSIPSIAGENILTDTHGRHHNYLRISLSERCNLRCQYCMPPEGVPLSHGSKLLSDGEITRLVHLFVRNGVTKVRLTGGEPLLRPNIVPLVQSISDSLATSKKLIDTGQSGLVGITTNGISLSRKIDGLVDAGLTSVNISLDTLRADRFMEITRRNGLAKVMRAIEDCTRAFREKYGGVRTGPGDTGGSRVKINCVVMKNFNDDELADFVRMSDERFGGEVDMRFIEWMPFNDNGWNNSRFVSYKDMIDKISNEGGVPMERISDGPNDTTKWWRTQSPGQESDGKARTGFITSMSEHFCGSCNRLRITADGMIKVCLFGSNEKEVSLRDIMRNHQSEEPRLQEEELGRVIHAAVQRKMKSLGGHGSAEDIAKAANNRPMTLIGG